ncbi:hypothetical protein CAQU_09530 [Corynebacterium aquilae DSM 44791]|uniref:GmrSD restriction endonucleases C-terminal domain-containing protein n=2 Tax=Corynebacterium aquilae TaxID=203263 RepID=A0A1L7CHG6_9CORY|nr:hypothetical protein CAQU_09530 [Corynebacterium aquilae DSM 44791]
MHAATPCPPKESTPRSRFLSRALHATVLGLGALLMACAAPSVPGSAIDLSPAQQELASLRTIDDPAPGYQRDAFGQRWSDDVEVDGGHNGCDTRNDVLRRDLKNLEIKKGTHDCVAYAGDFVDPYSGQQVHFQRGRNGNAAEVHIDHVVALANAWATGAHQWDDDHRRNFANDPMNLLVTTKEMNKSKGAKDAAQWMPPNRDTWCTYARTQVEVKKKYDLAVTDKERQALSAALSSCPTP